MGIAEKTLAMMRTLGTGPVYIKRGKIFYFLEDINEWFQQDGKHTKTSESGPALTRNSRTKDKTN